MTRWAQRARSRRGLVVDLRSARQHIGWMAPAAAGQLPLDARQLALGGLQGFLVLECFGNLLGDARQVGLLTPQAVLRRFELTGEGLEDMVEALKEAGDASDPARRRPDDLFRRGRRLLTSRHPWRGASGPRRWHPRLE
jgi:hypothetical protein